MSSSSSSLLRLLLLVLRLLVENVALFSLAAALERLNQPFRFIVAVELSMSLCAVAEETDELAALPSAGFGDEKLLVDLSSGDSDSAAAAARMSVRSG